MAKITYTQAGVDIEKEEYAIRGIKRLLEKTFRFRKGKIGTVMQDIGPFANLIDIGDYAIGICMDGVGSKVLVAQELKRYDTIGIDLVAMNVNDLICFGIEPVALVDYIATERIHPDIIKEIMHGIYKGAKQADIAVVGGELATLPDIIKGVGAEGFDLAGAAMGVVKKDKIINGEKIDVGDVVLGIRSSGIHSNGLTLARKVLPKSMWIELLIPTRIYVKPVLELLRRFDIHGMANITGGGFRNLLRVTKFGFLLDNMPDIPMIFKSIQENSKISDTEMYKTFNMGIGFCIILNKNDAERILLDYCDKFDIRKIGSVIERHVVRIKTNRGWIEIE